MSETQVEQFITQAIEHDLTYARARVRELHTDLERLKAAAQRIVQTCDSLLAAKPEDEESF